MRPCLNLCLFMNRILLRCSIGLLFCALVGCQTQQPATYSLTEADKEAILYIAENLPLILSEEGWDAYEAYFHPDYTNWSMIRDQVRTRDEFLGAVRSWYDAGNRASASTVRPVAFVPLAPDIVMLMRVQEETFVDPADPSIERTRDIRNVSVYKKEAGQWYVLSTSFMDKPESAE